MTHSRQAIRALLDGIGTTPRRGLGQNFVADPNTVRRIARLAGVGPGDRVVEIGAGLGSLTLALAETGAHVTAVEVDPRIVDALRDVMSDTPVTVIEADAMTLDWSTVLGGDDHWTLVANLPYNIATPLVCDLLDAVPAIDRMLVMVQREVAERFVAEPGSKQYGAVSVKIAYWATPRLVGIVPPSVFVPRPNVESALVEIVRRKPPATDPTALFSLVRTAFGQRRKMLRRSLAERVSSEQFAAAAIAPEARPEQLDVGAWCRLTEVVSSSTIELVAPAKLTLGLRITGRRDDGYHLIDAEMVSLDLHDILTIDRAREGLSVGGPFATGVPVDASNLVARALALIGCRAHVAIDKRIPPGGGLGGGSTDAAAVLRWGGVTDPAVAAGVGADVGFCLVGGRAHVRGIGDVVDPLPHVEHTVTLVVPPLTVSTPTVYRAWDHLGGLTAPGANDLEPAAIAVAPELSRWRDRIGELSGEQPVLAGSGATWFVRGEHSNALAVLSDEGAMVVTARTVPAAGIPA